MRAHFQLALVWLLLILPAGAAPLVSPEVASDRRVTFRYAGPTTGPVELIGRDPGKAHDFPSDVIALSRQEDGHWEVTVGPLLPGLYLYRFRVAGAEGVDPVNPGVQDFFAGPWSRVEVPDPAPQPWQPRADVPHGRVELRWFGRGGVGGERPICIYLPPGYDKSAEKLPVVYLLHGWDYDEMAWVNDGRVPTIMDNLIAAGRAQAMIVVMPLGYSQVPRNPPAWAKNEAENWTDQILRELIPWVERNYPVVPDREHRAITGFSMGGKQALVLGLGHPEIFAWTGAFSSGKHSLDNYPAAFAPALARGAPRMKLVWLGMGLQDPSEREGKLVSEKLQADGLPVIWHEIAGRHTWRVWRDCFAEFAKVVFQTKRPSP